MLRARHFDECLVSRSDQSLKGQLPPGDSLLRCCMDAMDQGKLKLPGFGGVQSKDSPELIQPDDDRILDGGGANDDWCFDGWCGAVTCMLSCVPAHRSLHRAGAHK